MPWQLLELPSLALGILHSRIGQTREHDTVIEIHGSLDWAEFLMTATDGELGPPDYLEIAEHGLHHGLGDWVFAGALHRDERWRDAELRAYASRTGLDIRTAAAMRPHADAFIDSVVDTVLADDPDVIGFTTTFMQNLPSLAVARRLKERRSDVTVVMGGANCDGLMGQALHRNHPFVDYVVRGEGELAFPQLLDHIEAGARSSDIPRVCWWDGERSIANDTAKGQVPPQLIPAPEFSAWQKRLESSVVAQYVEPKLVLEGARGCWWGEKHQCTFCGLNGSAITFRSKPAEQMWEEIAGLVRKHQILDIVMVDNILDMRYFDGLLPKMAASGWDLRVHYEVKSNLKPDQLSMLAEAGVVHIQPGIESLSSHPLSLMDKGVTGARNVGLLRDCEERGLTVSWNYLYGFPGEADADYRATAEQMPALVHLQPPGGVIRIALERFSPNFERPELGFPERRPAAIYDHIYDLPVEELMDLVYLFDTPPQGITGPVEDLLHQQAEKWLENYPGSALLVVEDSGERLVIEDRRVGWARRQHVLEAWRCVGYRLLDRPRTAASLRRALAENGLIISEGELDGWLAALRASGLVFQDRVHHVALATTRQPLRVDLSADLEVYA